MCTDHSKNNDWPSWNRCICYQEKRKETMKICKPFNMSLQFYLSKLPVQTNNLRKFIVLMCFLFFMPKNKRKKNIWTMEWRRRRIFSKWFFFQTFSRVISLLKCSRRWTVKYFSDYIILQNARSLVLRDNANSCFQNLKKKLYHCFFCPNCQGILWSIKYSI